MSADTDRTAERLRQHLDTRRDALREAAPQSSLSSRLGGHLFLAGDRVLDLVTGELGDVVAATDTITPTAAAVSIRFPDGGIVTRSVSQLLLRPAPSSAKP